MRNGDRCGEASDRGREGGSVPPRIPEILPAMPHRCNSGDMQLFAAIMLVLGFLRWPGTETRKRGKVLRDASSGPGLLIVEGQQYPFSLTDLWKSDQPPKAGMVVEAEFSRDGQLLAIRTISRASH